MSRNSASITKPDQAGRNRKIFLLIASLLGGVFLIIIALFTIMNLRMNSRPPELNLSTSLSSEAGLFRVSYEPAADIRANQIHTWVLHVETPDGMPVENAVITVDGDMPQHGHGLPTRPQVTGYLGNGDYQVEGLKFHMQGWWIVEFEIKSNGQSDHITFNLVLDQ
jgi:hypothetical protein